MSKFRKVFANDNDPSTQSSRGRRYAILKKLEQSRLRPTAAKMENSITPRRPAETRDPITLYKDIAGIRGRHYGRDIVRIGGGDDDDDDDEEEPDDSILNPTDRKQHKVIYHKFGDQPDVLVHETNGQVPRPLDHRHVVVKVQASTVSPQDCLIRRGIDFSLWDPVALPITPGMDCVGHVVSVGSTCELFKEGDRVAALVQVGGNARYVNVPEDKLVHVPRSLDAGEAVCLVSTYMTAFQALKNAIARRHSLPRTLLVTDALCPVSQAILQLAAREGVQKAFATAPTQHHKYVKSVLGATPLSTDPKEWLPVVQGKVDVVVDSTCEDGFESSQKALGSNGVLVCVGMSGLLNKEGRGVFGVPISARWTQTKAAYFMSNTIVYDLVTSLTTDPEAFKVDLAHLFDLLWREEIKPHIAKRISLSDVGDTHQSLQMGKIRGTVICLPWKKSTNTSITSIARKPNNDGTVFHQGFFSQAPKISQSCIRI